jgi:hypothetical protein
MVGAAAAKRSSATLQVARVWRPASSPRSRPPEAPRSIRRSWSGRPPRSEVARLCKLRASGGPPLHLALAPPEAPRSIRRSWSGRPPRSEVARLCKLRASGGPPLHLALAAPKRHLPSAAHGRGGQIARRPCQSALRDRAGVVTTPAAFELRACGKLLTWPPLAWGQTDFTGKHHGKGRNHSKGEMVGAARLPKGHASLHFAIGQGS